MPLLKCMAQEALITAQERGYRGRFIFIICRKGGERIMGKKIESDRVFLADAKLKFIKYVEPKKRKKKQ